MTYDTKRLRELLAKAAQPGCGMRSAVNRADAIDELRRDVHKWLPAILDHIDDLETRVEEEKSYIDNAVSKSPEPLRQLGEYLAGLLDEDEWPHAERYLNAAVTAGSAERAHDEAVEKCAAIVEAEADKYLPGGPDDMKRIFHNLASAVRALAAISKVTRTSQAGLP